MRFSAQLLALPSFVAQFFHIRNGEESGWSTIPEVSPRYRVSHYRTSSTCTTLHFCCRNRHRDVRPEEGREEGSRSLPPSLPSECTSSQGMRLIRLCNEYRLCNEHRRCTWNLPLGILLSESTPKFNISVVSIRTAHQVRGLVRLDCINMQERLRPEWSFPAKVAAV